MTKLRFRPDGCVILALMLLILPFPWIISMAFAVMIHEIGHILAIFLSGGKIETIEIGSFGANIQVTQLPVGKELLCALAGPAAGLTLLLFARQFPYVAVCAFFHSLYNLLPIYPLDGGRVMGCFLLLAAPKYACAITKIIGFICKCVIVIGCSYCAVVLKLELWLPAMIAVMVLRNNPCNVHLLGVQ